jgi:flavin-dependent dehydrogenase
MTGGTRGNGMSDPVIVVGAGPAGLACAIRLARNGCKVVLREAHDTAGMRFHGDFQGLENWSSETDVLDELTKMGIMTNFDRHPVYSGIAFDAWGGRHEVKSERPLYYLVRRGREPGTLDQSLLAQAKELGVALHFNDRAGHVHGPGVLAGGPRRADAIAAGYVFATDMPDGNWICFDNDLAPLGYSYLLVYGGRGTVASCMFTGFKREAEYVARTVAAFEDRAGLMMRDARPFGGFANFRLPRTAVQGGHPVVGEQAGFQDALAGFGMRYAMRSGILAARSLMEGVDYAALWRKELLPQLRTSVSNRFLFTLVGESGWRRMLARLSDGDTGLHLRRLYRPSILSRLLFPLARWRYRAPLRDPSCDHVGCGCVWCRCGHDEIMVGSAGAAERRAS